MPPKKPWQTRTNPQTAVNISEIIQSNPTIKEQIVKQDPSINSPISPSINSQNSTAANSLINKTDTTNAYGNSTLGGAYGSNYGSSYGGYGGYGSSYGGIGGGGYGSYGAGGLSSYGMGYGGMGYGRYGMMGGENQNGFLMNSLMTLQSFGYLINILCQIARSLNTNCQGLYIFYQSFKNLAQKIKNGVIGSFQWIGQKVKKLFTFLLNLIANTLFFWRRNDQTQKYKAISVVLKCLVILFAMSLYPVVKKGFNSIKA